MKHRIGRLVEPLLRWLFPGRGRHRLPVVEVASGRRGRHRAVPGAQGATAHRAGCRPLRGEDHVMVRPYLVEHEQRERREQRKLREHARQQQARRRALWLATRGVDIGSRVIHGVEVSA
ncbi:hypothetical protein J8N05_11625 [Streptomyces sp. BH-SS-21]|uniref:Uncharacterized protein n=1 Tax=Streptomyces liliiviolaceus TaxID=2823109 RepID=A0A940XMT8_9ACTN|nr:hypothetical protein [Streptomyces liliiviolaceus]MBQ0848854.1 hypothetical protein [Streptomyces liliiviolaceus]